ncbi:MAG: hypothetical protein FWE19_09910 [Oscillospiraceae bacterium]|nr:hypothetical protein [Oscillospiraceae bacterium]
MLTGLLQSDGVIARKAAAKKYSSSLLITRHTVVVSDRNIFEKLLVILEFTHFIKNHTASRRFKNKDIINEFTVSVAVNIAGLNISISEE